jgi:hypothetical protein
MCACLGLHVSLCQVYVLLASCAFFEGKPDCMYVLRGYMYGYQIAFVYSCMGASLGCMYSSTTCTSYRLHLRFFSRLA